MKVSLCCATYLRSLYLLWLNKLTQLLRRELDEWVFFRTPCIVTYETSEINLPKGEEDMVLMVFIARSFFYPCSWSRRILAIKLRGIWSTKEKPDDGKKISMKRISKGLKIGNKKYFKELHCLSLTKFEMRMKNIFRFTIN